MKRATTDWLAQDFPSEQANAAAREIHVTLARQDAEIRRLRAEMKVIATMPAQSDGGGSKWNHQKVATAALSPKRKAKR